VTQTFTIKNCGDVATTINSITITGNNPAGAGDFPGDYNDVHGCRTLQVNDSCSVSVTFTPGAAGIRNAVLHVNTSNAGTVNVSLSGSGVGQGGNTPAITVSPFSLTFPAQPQGTTSSSLSTTITNLGPTSVIVTAALTSGGVSGGTGFSASGLGTFTLGPGQSRTIGASFQAAAGATLGNYSGNIQFSYPGGSSNVSLFATVIAPLPELAVAVAPSSLNFGNVLFPGGTAGPLSVDFINVGDPVTITGISFVNQTGPGQFSSTFAAPVTVDTFDDVLIPVTFTPQGLGLSSATLRITTNIAGTFDVQLTGTGTAPFAQLTLKPLIDNFGNVQVNTTSGPGFFTLTNNGNATATGIVASVTGPFSIIGGVPATLAAGASTTIEVRATPTALGVQNGSLTVTSANAGSVIAPLSVTGVAQPSQTPGILSIFPGSLSFTQAVNTQTTQLISICNVGGQNLTLFSANIGGANAGSFQLLGSPIFPQILGPNVCYIIPVQFTSTSKKGDFSAFLTVSTSAAGSPQIVSLGGFVTDVPSAPTLTATPGSVNFGQVNAGTNSGVQFVTLTAGGTGVLSITGVSLTGANANQFTIVSDTGGIGLASGGQRIIGVKANPTSSGVKSANLHVTTLGSPGTLDVPLTVTAP